MKKIFRIFALLLAFCSLICTVACKKDNEQQDNPPVVEVKESSIQIVESTVPSKVYLSEVDSIFETIKIKVVKTDNSEEQINLTKNMLSLADYSKLSSEGTHTVKVKYLEFETTLTINVEKDPEIEVKEPIPYTVIVKDIAGKPLADFYVTVYLGNEIVAEKYTNAEGTFTAELLPNIYDIIIEAREGYFLNQELYETDLLGSVIEVTCELDSLKGIEAEYGHVYELGDMMYDFTLTDIDNNELNLYTLLETYEAVILNFWYTTCSYCNLEFPYMVDAYESSYTDESGNVIYYKDKVAIIAINPTTAGNGDTIQGMKQYRDSMGLTFNVAPDYDGDTSNLTMDPALTSMFYIEGYPTTVVIDKFGLIAEVEAGAITDISKWTQTFDKYIAEDYYPEFTGQVNGVVEMEKPNITQEDSSLLEEAANGINYDGTRFECTYTPEDNDDAEYSWPWVVAEYKGLSCIKPSNQNKNPSFAIFYITIHLNVGEAFAFDYFSSTESYDTLYITANGVIATSISGMSPDWEKSYAFVAVEEGEYEIGFVYYKDGSASQGEDAVFLRNLRIVQEEQIDKVTYIFREAASGTINEITMSYPSYVNVVYNENDGYYHVGTIDGPLLLADMLSGSQWSNSTIYEISLEGKCKLENGKDYTALIEKYAILASNSTVGYCPVTKELADAFKDIVAELGHEDAKTNKNQWLELCVYYSAYGTGGVELSTPTYGVSPWEPIMFDGDGINTPASASAVFDRIILPRGFIFGFTPSQNGVYKFYSTEEINETLGWVCDSEGNVIQNSEVELRVFAEQSSKGEIVDHNFVCYVYLEAGNTYLFRAAFYDVAEYSEITVEMKYVDEKLNLLTIASPGPFTTSDDEMTDIISGNYVDYELGEDGYYHVVGQYAEDSFLYCDVEYMNAITGYSIIDCASDRFNAFDFNKDEYGQSLYDSEGYYRITDFDENNVMVRLYVCVDAEGNEYYVTTVGENGYTEENGYTYIKNDGTMDNKADFNAYVNEYIAINKITDENSELYGCVKVDEEFARVLWLLMNKYTFAGIEGSWLKLCYYYKYVGPVAE